MTVSINSRMVNLNEPVKIGVAVPECGGVWSISGVRTEPQTGN